MALTSAERQKRYRAAHPERARESCRRYMRKRYATDAAFREKAKSQATEWGRKNKARRRDIILKNRYCRIRAGQYDAMLLAQQGICAICGKPSVGRSLEVDHNHKTEQIRGLLCHGCNVGIGFLGDDVARVEKAVQYLKKFEEQSDEPTRSSDSASGS